MITSKTIANGIIRAVIVLALLYVLLLLLSKIQSIIIFVIFAIILTMIGNPIINFLKRRCKLPHLAAVILTLLLYVSILTGLVLLFIPLIASQGKNLSILNTTDIEAQLATLLSQIKAFLEGYNIDSSSILQPSEIASQLDMSFVPAFINGLLNTLSSFGIGFASVMFITFFFLKDREMFIKGVRKALPENHKEKIIHSLDKINDLLSRYFVGLLFQLFIIFVLYLIVLLIFGIPNAVVIAFFCAVLNIIPYIGPLISSVFAAVLTMLSHLGENFQSEVLPATIYVLIGFWIVQVIDNNVSQPLIFSNSVKSHPLEIFLVILIAGFLSGIAGMIIAVPLYTMVKVVAKEFLPENKVVQQLTKDI
ncbi:MAG TPA: AI-2E family transporter [Flavobacterium sp.]